MDQMNAHVYELHGQIYRRNVPLEKISQTNYAFDAKYTNVVDEDDFEVACENVTETAIEEVGELILDKEQPTTTSTRGSKFVKFDDKKKVFYSTLEIPSNLVGLVAGAKYKNIAALEASTGTKIKVPKKSAQLSEFIEIYADSAQKVERATDRLELDILNARQKSQPTHFVSFPLSRHVALCNAYAEFVRQVCACEDIPEQCREEKLFRPVEKIHLTVSVLRLFSEDDERVAKNCLTDFIDAELTKYLKNAGSIPIKFTKLDFFGPNKSKTRVVYAAVESEILQQLANAMDDRLVSTGLAEKRKTPNVVLHMTIINTKHGKMKAIDVTELLARFGNYKFPSVELSEVRICTMNEVDPYTKGHPTIFSSGFAL